MPNLYDLPKVTYGEKLEVGMILHFAVREHFKNAKNGLTERWSARELQKAFDMRAVLMELDESF